MNGPKVSIIVPVYQVEKYLDDCIQSILTQSFKNFELLLVDDGSFDKSPEICDIYAQKNACVRTFHKPNGGLADARNFGLDKAQGEYVTFVDSDDYLAKGGLQLLYDEMIASGADIVLGKMERFLEGQGTRPYTRLEEKKEMVGKEALVLILQGQKINISMCGGLYKKAIFDTVRMPKGYICEDWYVTPSIYLKARKVVFTPVSWYMYRDNPKSVMGTLLKRPNPQIIEIAQHAISVIKEDDEQLYLRTLWGNLKRVWKYVGITYQLGKVKEEKAFLFEVRSLLKQYLPDLKKSNCLNFAESIGVWSFCYCPPLCAFLYKIKK